MGNFLMAIEPALGNVPAHQISFAIAINYDYAHISIFENDRLLVCGSFYPI
jgi:hypothetical protein